MWNPDRASVRDQAETQPRPIYVDVPCKLCPRARGLLILPMGRIRRQWRTAMGCEGRRNDYHDLRLALASYLGHYYD